MVYTLTATIMNIAFISYWSCPLNRTGVVLTAGGMNIYVINLANYLSKLRHKVDIYTRVHKEFDEKILKLHSNVRIVHLSRGTIENMKEFSSNVTNFINKYKLNYDILHAHYYYSGLIGMELKTRLSIPLLITFHSLGKTKELLAGIIDKTRLGFEKQVIDKADGIVASTELEKSDLIEYYGADSNKILVVSPGVNHHMFTPKDRILSRIKLHLPIKPKIILFVGRIDPIKGISFLIESIADLSNKYPGFKNNFRVLLIGGDIKSDIFWLHPEVKKIKQLIIDKNIECCVKFLGSSPHSKLSDYYTASDVVVMPSLYESFGLVVLEAMSCGCCVLVSRVGGLKYLIDDFKNGRFFESGRKEDLKKVLWQLLNDQKLREKLGKEAFKASQKYCWDIQAQKMIDAYKRFI